MGIDRIGKGGPPAPSKPPAGPERAQGGEGARTFEVRPSTPSTTTPASVAPTGAAATPLERLRTGEIDLDRYLDLKVNEATAHLKGLRAHEMEGVRSLLREQLASDPTLVDLVQQATGQIPTSKE